MSADIIIQQSFAKELCPYAAELYDAAFSSKLSIAIPDAESRQTVLEKGFKPNFSFVALKNHQLVGIAGFKTIRGSLTGGISFQLLRETIGIRRALRAITILGLFQRKQLNNQLLMDGIRVSGNMRGKGIGTKLLHKIIDYAKKERYRTIRLDVIDTNPAAFRLYERIGFVPVKTEQFTYLKWLLGFKASTQMVYRLKSNS